MMYKVVRRNHSGGSVGVGLSDEGHLTYSYEDEFVIYVSSWDVAQRLLKMARRDLPTYDGQTSWVVVEVGG